MKVSFWLAALLVAGTMPVTTAAGQGLEVSPPADRRRRPGLSERAHQGGTRRAPARERRLGRSLWRSRRGGDLDQSTDVLARVGLAVGAAYPPRLYRRGQDRRSGRLPGRRH